MRSLLAALALPRNFDIHETKKVSGLAKVSCVQAPIAQAGSRAKGSPKFSEDEAVYRFQNTSRSCEKNMPMIAIMAPVLATAEAALLLSTSLSSPQGHPT